MTQMISIGVTGHPNALAFDGACVWVADSSGVKRIRASSGQVVATYPMAGPWGLAFDGVHLVAQSPNGVLKLSVDTGALVGRYAFDLASDDQPAGLIADGSHVWILNYRHGSVSKLRARTGEILGTYPAGERPSALASDGRHLWVANEFAQTVTKLDAATGALMGVYPVRGSSGGIVCDGRHVWVSGTGEGGVTKLAADTGAIAWERPAGGSPQHIAFDGRLIWAADQARGLVTRIDADTGAFVDTLALPSPTRMVFDGTCMWVANYAHDNVTRIVVPEATQPGTRPMQQIEHVVLLMMENRSFDSLLGWLYEKDDPAHHVPPLRQGERVYEGLQELDLAAFENADATGRIKARPTRGAQGLNVPNLAPGENFAQVATQLYEWPFQMTFAPPIQMTPGGVLAAGGWRTQDVARTISDDDARSALAAAMAENSSQTQRYFSDFALSRPKDGPPDKDLPGKAAIVVFLRDAKIRDVAWLKQNTDENHRNTLIAWLSNTYGMPVGELQARSNQDLVMIAWTRSRQPSMKGYVRDYANELRHLAFPEDTVARYASQVMQSFTPDQLPVINGLAEHYAVGDMWFSSVPSQTNPNRAFAMCGTSMGLVNNGFLETDPRAARIEGAAGYLIGDDRFEAKTIFNALQANSTWKVFYQSGYLPSNIYNAVQIATGGNIATGIANAARAPLLALGQAILAAVGAEPAQYLKELSSPDRVSDYTHRLFPKIHDIADSDQRFAKLDEFHASARAGTLPHFSYLQPEWTIAHAGTGGGFGTTLGIQSVLFHQGRDYHPPGNLDAAENLVRDIYASLTANRAAWEKTLLVLTFDEPVGAFDHVPPPAALPPWGDGPSPVKLESGFDFRRYGGRVPAILVSPWIRKGTVFRSPTGVPYDHTSLIATVLKWRGLEGQIPEFGQRTANAPTFDGVLSLKSARTDEKAIRFLRTHRRGSPLAFHDRFWLKDYKGRYIAGFKEHYVMPFSTFGIDPNLSEFFPVLDGSAPPEKRTEFYFVNAADRPDPGDILASPDRKVRLVAADSGLGAYNVLGAWRDSTDVYFFNDYLEGDNNERQNWTLVKEKPGPVHFGDQVAIQSTYEFSTLAGGTGQCLVPCDDHELYMTTIVPGKRSWHLHFYEHSEYLWTVEPVARP